MYFNNMTFYLFYSIVIIIIKAHTLKLQEKQIITNIKQKKKTLFGGWSVTGVIHNKIIAQTQKFPATLPSFETI